MGIVKYKEYIRSTWYPVVGGKEDILSPESEVKYAIMKYEKEKVLKVLKFLDALIAVNLVGGAFSLPVSVVVIMSGLPILGLACMLAAIYFFVVAIKMEQEANKYIKYLKDRQLIIEYAGV